MEMKQLKSITILSILLAVCLAVVSFSGSFIAGTYERETPSMAAQGTGQDVVNLFLVVPLLVLSLAFLRKKSKIALFIFGGTVFYILYSYFLYAFGVHFNGLFLLYCAILGLSLYLFILFMHEATQMDLKGMFRTDVPARLIGVYLFLVAVMFYGLWLKDIVPSILEGSVPSSVSDYNLVVNPVHVLDIAVALPGLILTSLLFTRNRRLGYILAPIVLVFTIILAVALTAMVVVVKLRGISEDVSVAGFFIILAVISSVLLVLLLKKMKPAAEEIGTGNQQ